MNVELASRVSVVAPSSTLVIDNKAKQMKLAGVDVCSFAAGEPDFDTPPNIKEAAVRALSDNFTRYTPSSGIPELRQALSKKFERDYGLAYKPSQIIVSCGAKHACFNSILALCQEGDEVIVPSPYWVSYPEMVRLVQATPVMAPMTEDTGFKLTAEQFRDAMTPRTKLLILNSPNNPSGAVYTREELLALVEVAAEEDIWILSDEIYDQLVYDGARHECVAAVSPEAKELTIVVNGFSKTFAMTGWRLGYLAAPEPVANAVDSIQSHSTSNPTSFVQKAALEALNGPQDFLAQWVAEYDRRRRRLCEGLNSIKGLQCAAPQGAFFVFPSIAAFGMSSGEFASRLLEQEKVAVVPGIAFGSDQHIRLSYACSMENIEKGLERIARFCGSLGG